MKTFIASIAMCFLFASTTYGQWLPEKSCNSKAADITDQAIAHMLNLETPFAVGMANAALMVDPDCGSAKLLKINAAMAGNFGNRAEQLEKLDTSNLSDTEMAWYSIMVNEQDDWQGVRMNAVNDHPDVPLFQFWGAMASDEQLPAIKKFSESFPDYASPAYNMISYSYSLSDDAEFDLGMAIEAIEKAIAMHDGPNAYDSRAEHYAEAGDFEKALESQLQAMNYAAGPSAYQQSATIYWRTTNKGAWADSIKAYTKERVRLTMMNDIEGQAKFQPESMSMIACNSNMGPCELVDEPTENVSFTWNSWDVGEVDVNFNEEMTMAITTYTSTGNYTMNDSGDEVDYHTRASEVWQLEGGSWKLVHSNFAPMPGGEGLPRM
ncbi:MAG TPA: hypothetical protein VKM36_11590 [Balneolaceae bacterium]|nr:hypothetical protein [Balneolaceae bacterium]